MTERYENVFKKMKEEFFGIDAQIELILKSIETWEVTKDYIVRPNIFNIVGLTGVGKTAVINRIMDLLELKEKTVYLKFNNKTTDVIDSLKSNNISDSIFLFDEFQYLRTKNERGEELKESDDKGFNIVWDLLDSGEVVLQRDNSYYFGLQAILYMLRDFIKYEVEYKDGIFSGENLEFIINKHKLGFDSIRKINKFKESMNNGIYSTKEDSEEGGLFRSMMKGTSSNEASSWTLKGALKYNSLSRALIDGKLNSEENDNEISKDEMTISSFLPVSYDTLMGAIGTLTEKYKFQGEYEFKAFMFSIGSITELYDFFFQFENSKPMPIVKDFKNSLIITLSNIDEAYTIANQVGSDLDADFFHKYTSNISIIKIREALLNRFRAEQIARFGSNYILYPSLNKKSFQKIISKELDSFADMVKTKFNGDTSIKVSELTFTKNIHDIIYLEGVFPIIGARSVFSTVGEIVSEKLSNIIVRLLNIDIENKDIRIEFDYKKRSSNIIVNYYNNASNDFICKDEIKYNVKVNNLRKEDKKNIGKQAHRAVHEAGHAVCSVILMDILPEVVYSTVMESKGAFNMFTEDDFYYDRKNTYLKHIATLMGGYAAESIIFGEDNVSNGSSSDIAKATNKLNSLYKDCGFGDKIGRFVSQQMPGAGFEDRNYSIVDENEFDNLIIEKLKESKILAESTLNEQKNLLLKLSEQLIKSPKMNKKKIKEFIGKYAVGYDMMQLEKNQTIFYLDLVNSEIENLNNLKAIAISEK